MAEATIRFGRRRGSHEHGEGLHECGTEVVLGRAGTWWWVVVVVVANGVSGGSGVDPVPSLDEAEVVWRKEVSDGLVNSALCTGRLRVQLNIPRLRLNSIERR